MSNLELSCVLKNDFTYVYIAISGFLIACMRGRRYTWIYHAATDDFTYIHILSQMVRGYERSGTDGYSCLLNYWRHCEMLSKTLNCTKQAANNPFSFSLE